MREEALKGGYVREEALKGGYVREEGGTEGRVCEGVAVGGSCSSLYDSTVFLLSLHRDLSAILL